MIVHPLIDSVFQNSKSTRGARTIMLCLAHYADEDGLVEISQGKLSKLTLISTKQVKRTLSILIDMKEISLVSSPQTRANSTVYRFLPPIFTGDIRKLWGVISDGANVPYEPQMSPQLHGMSTQIAQMSIGKAPIKKKEYIYSNTILLSLAKVFEQKTTMLPLDENHKDYDAKWGTPLEAAMKLANGDQDVAIDLIHRAIDSNRQKGYATLTPSSIHKTMASMGMVKQQPTPATTSDKEAHTLWRLICSDRVKEAMLNPNFAAWQPRHVWVGRIKKRDAAYENVMKKEFIAEWGMDHV